MKNSKNIDDNIITKFSISSIKRYRITILILIGILFIGFLSYFNLLKKEGFPSIDVPILLIQTPYLSGDATKTDKEVTNLILDELKKYPDIESVETNSTDVFSSIVVRFPLDFKNIEDYKKDIEDSISKLTFPKNVRSEIVIPNASTIDGRNDLILMVSSSEKSIKEMQDLAIDLSGSLSKSPLVKSAQVLKQIENRFDFSQGKEIEITSSFARIGYKDENGKLKFENGVNIGIQKKNSDIGTLELSSSIREKVNEFVEETNLENFKISFTGDQAVFLEKQIQSLENNAVMAIFTIFIVLMLFINLRSAFILGFFIPLVLGAIFLFFYILGYSLNTISLFALVLVLGLFVDDGTVVIEAIDAYKKKGFKGIQAVKKAISDIGIADISGTITTILVFLPLVFISGILGDFIRFLPLTVILSLVISLVVALGILPLLGVAFLSNKSEVKRGLVFNLINFFPNFILRSGDSLGRFVKYYLKKRILSFLILFFTIIFFLFGSSFASLLSFSFFAPAKDSDIISLSLTFPEQQSIDVSKESAMQVEEILNDLFSDEIESLAYIRNSQISSIIQIRLVPIQSRSISANQITEDININTKEIDGVSVNASSISAGPPVQQFPFAMQIYGEDITLLNEIIGELENFVINRELSSDNKVEDIQIQYLNTVARKNMEKFVEFRAKFTKNSDSSALIKLQNDIEKEFFEQLKLEKYKGLRFDFDFGQESDNAESFNSVVFMALFALLVIYGVLVFQFNSFLQPFLVLIAIPFSLPGVLIGLYLTNNPFSFFVVIGLTGLLGIVVNNTIMLLEYANQKRKEGKSISDSIAEAVSLRFRPIFVTTVTTIAGLLPLALNEPFWEPLSFTIIFGLISSLSLVLFAFPIFYVVFEKLRSKKDRFLKRIGVDLY